ncbi:hypothetical protein SAMN05518672_1011134 [Chitinophaga sp. CF118]|uniref:hypothetical protein n=1 Tax=Chitinophaga sp. CF118 TaxID=1884367 RepID=UPI0008E2EF93|nr:hypothetical protein [Chitinophaga sp. CF118]SFD22585.1 hypothetical protein SAMN05518672_1011134 [Chitinophaga sp. CF118]
MKLLIGVLLLISSNMMAQQHIAQFAVWKPKPGLEKKFENGYKQHLLWHKNSGDTWNWYGWYVVSGPQDGCFIDATFGHKWEDFDKPVSPAEDGADNELHTVPFGDFLWRYKVEKLPHLSTPDSSVLNAKLLRLISLSVSELPAALKLMEKLKDREMDSILGFQIYKMVDGGDLNQLIILIGCNSFKEFGKTAHFQEEIAALEIASEVKVINSIRSETLLYKPEMSLLP